MREITEKEYLDFIEKNKFVEIGKEKISLEPIRVERFEPKDDEITQQILPCGVSQRGAHGQPTKGITEETGLHKFQGF